jgi:hypothetical protein
MKPPHLTAVYGLRPSLAPIEGPLGGIDLGEENAAAFRKLLDR